MARKVLTQAEMIEDFKQYVTVTVTTVVKESEDRLRSEMHDGFSGIADILENHQLQLDNLARS